MTIEGSSKVVGHKPVTGDTTRMGKGKGAGSGASDALGGAGVGADFSALINSFDSESVGDDVGAPQLAIDQPAPALQRPLDPPLNLLPQILPNDLELLLAQASQVSADRSNSLQAMALGTQLSAPISMSAADFVTSSALVPLSSGSASNQPALSGLVGMGGLTSLNPNTVPASGLPTLTEGPTDAAGSPKALHADGILSLGEGPTEVAVPVDLLLNQSGQGTFVRPLKSRIADSLLGVGGAMADSRMLNSSASIDVVSRETSLMGTLVSSGLGEGLTRPREQGSDKSSFSLAGSGGEGLWGQQTFQAGTATETVSVPAGTSTSSMESMVADTVSYWVTQGVKHAALKLDGFGELPLEVSISMQGGEAQIDFRTDQPEIRQILEGAMTHLTDLLKSEGVVLSGVSVGASGQNSGGRQDERNRSGARQGTVVTTKPLSPDSPRPVNLPTGRVLDLFV